MSSDMAADWLLHGIAAAQAGEKEEARDLLEHALVELDFMAEVYGTNDTDAREKAWYWLSLISDDPKQKRDYLENILASNPSNPDARRGLAILDGRLKPEEIVDPERANVPLTPAAAPQSSEVRRFVCPQCGGKLSFNPATQMLACEYCGYLVSQSEARGQDATSVQRHIAEGEGPSAGGQNATSVQRRSAVGGGPSAGGAGEQDFVAAVYTARAHRWELPTERIVSCKSCGAHFTLPPSRRTAECPFCGSAHIVNSTDNAELIEPGGVIPFQFDEEDAIRQLRQWVAAQHLGKSDVQHAAFARPRPVYFPFWTFNMGGEVRWHGSVPHYRKESGVMAWAPRTGSVLAIVDNLLVGASHSLPAALLNAFGAPISGASGEQQASSLTFNFSAVAPYAEKYLADWPVEIYQIPLADASLVARERAFAGAKRRASPGPGVVNVSYDSVGISIDTYKLILLPIWVSQVHFKDKVYPLVVNGQSGDVYGKLPQGGLHGLLAGLLGD
jgi:DNA-directed RNA polymerase subunit RPC12/RpoP